MIALSPARCGLALVGFVLAATVGSTAAAPSYVDGLAANLEPTRFVAYRTIGDVALRLAVFEPTSPTAAEKGVRPVGVFFHGGGWSGGSPRMMYPFAAWWAEQGGVGVSVEYRRYHPKRNVSVFDCVDDAVAAVHYLREHATELRLDARRMWVSGASAGGHLAFETALRGEPVAAVVLLSPVIDTSETGYGQAKIGERWRELSPRHQVRAGLPPTLVLHGTADTLTPFAGAEAFRDAMVRSGNICELIRVPEGQHTYMFKDAALYAEALVCLRRFLREHALSDVGTLSASAPTL